MGVEAVGRQAVGGPAADGVRVGLGVELDSPCPFSHPEGLVRAVFAGHQPHRVRGKGRDGVPMPLDGGDAAGQPGEERVVVGFGPQDQGSAAELRCSVPRADRAAGHVGQ